MTDYSILYSKFQFKPNEAEQLRELHMYASNNLNKSEKILVTTIIKDNENTKGEEDA